MSFGEVAKICGILLWLQFGVFKRNIFIVFLLSSPFKVKTSNHSIDFVGGSFVTSKSERRFDPASDIITFNVK